MVFQEVQIGAEGNWSTRNNDIRIILRLKLWMHSHLKNGVGCEGPGHFNVHVTE
jgi:hypothetical protein